MEPRLPGWFAEVTPRINCSMPCSGEQSMPTPRIAKDPANGVSAKGLVSSRIMKADDDSSCSSRSWPLRPQTEKIFGYLRKFSEALCKQDFHTYPGEGRSQI